jgi:hypothetical protein
VGVLHPVNTILTTMKKVRKVNDKRPFIFSSPFEKIKLGEWIDRGKRLQTGDD